MNSKIKNYVDVLFKDIPNTKKASELKEEILSNLNDHFEAHIAEGKSENQAYTEALQDLGDVDELLKDIEPNQELKGKIESYRKTRAKNTAISVMLYIISVVFVVGFGAAGELAGKEESLGVIGVILMFLCIAAATGLLIYTHMSIPSDVAEYTTKKHAKNSLLPSSAPKVLNSIMQLYWPLVLILYLGVSFATSAWAYTWMIWIIAVALKNALYAFFTEEDDDIQ